MIVRVFDKSANAYFKSMVYAKINTGWYEKQLVLVPDADGAYFKFFDFLDKEDASSPQVLINIIAPGVPDGWIFKRSGSVDKKLPEYELVLEEEIRFFEFMGFPWIYDDSATMLQLLHGEPILAKGSIFEDQIISHYESGWNYVETQNDINFLMEQTAHFHDSIIKTLNYVSGGYVHADRSMCPVNDVRKVTIIIESQCCNPVELVFEGVTALNLRPAGDNDAADIFEASVFIKDAMVYFCDDSLKDFDTEYEGTWITAYNLKWRFINESKT